MDSYVHTGTSTHFFKQLVDGALDHQGVGATEGSDAYLVQLLDSFVTPQAMFHRAEVAPENSLAEIFCAALNSEGMRQFRLFKLSGDMSLFIAGFLSDSLRSKAVDVDYYEKLGGSAYGAVAHCCHSRSGAAVFEELAEKFNRFVDVLNEVSEECNLTDRGDILRLYERYARTKSQRCERLLGELGVAANPALLDQVH